MLLPYQIKLFSISSEKAFLGKVVLFLIFLIPLKSSLDIYRSITQWEEIRNNVFMEKRIRLSEYDLLYPRLKNNSKFLLDYGQFLYSINNIKAIEVLEESKKLSSNSAVLETLSNIYEEKENFPNAIENAKDLSNLIPYKFKYKENLMKQYYKNGDSIRLKEISKIIVKMPVKRPSNEVDYIKNSALQNLNKNK